MAQRGTRTRVGGAARGRVRRAGETREAEKSLLASNGQNKYEGGTRFSIQTFESPPSFPRALGLVRVRVIVVVLLLFVL